MRAIEALKSHLKEGCVYRRQVLENCSNAVDRHLNKLQDEKLVVKLSGGLYYCPKKSKFGTLPPSEDDLVEAFLGDSRFLILSFNAYNGLEVGTTQLYKETVVYNHKRHGEFKLGNRSYKFVIRHFFPKKLTEEFLLVDLVNNSKKLAEDMDDVLMKIDHKVKGMDQEALKKVVDQYGLERTKKFFDILLRENGKDSSSGLFTQSS